MQRSSESINVNNSLISQWTTHHFGLLIDGDLVPGDQSMEIINPANERMLATGPRASRRQLDRAVAAAKGAFPSWAATALAERQIILNAIADKIEQNDADLADLLTREQGKPLRDAISE